MCSILQLEKVKAWMNTTRNLIFTQENISTTLTNKTKFSVNFCWHAQNKFAMHRLITINTYPSLISGYGSHILSNVIIVEKYIVKWYLTLLFCCVSHEMALKCVMLPTMSSTSRNIDLKSYCFPWDGTEVCDVSHYVFYIT